MPSGAWLAIYIATGIKTVQFVQLFFQAVEDDAEGGALDVIDRLA